jgi:tetratricopeptide (TPR) repeat protein
MSRAHYTGRPGVPGARVLRCLSVERWRYAPHVAVTALAAGLYLQTLRFGFVLDDKHLIVDNTFVRESFSPLLAFAHHFWHGSSAAAIYYRPLVNASLALNGRLLGWGPAGFHLGNVVLHSLNAVLVLLLSRRLGAARWPALAAAALMAVHPAASWAVASIVARVDILPALFVLLAWSAYAGPAAGDVGDRPRLWKRPLIVGLLFLGALLSKESALAFLVVPVLGLRRMRVDSIGVTRAAPVWGTASAHVLACGLALAASVGLRRFAGVGWLRRWNGMDPFVNPMAGVGFPGRVYDALRLSGRYLLYLFAPVWFSDPTDYAAPPRIDAGVVLAGLGLLACTAGLLVLWLRRDPVALPLGFSLAAFLPASNLLVPIASIYALNFLYMPLLGLCLAAGLLLTRVPTRWRGPETSADRPPGWLWAALPLAALLLVASSREAAIWRDGVALATAWSDRFPHYAFARGSLGVALLDRGDSQAAVPPLRQALSIDDRSAETRFNLGLALLLTARNREELEEALRWTRLALDLDPGYAAARVNAGHILLRLDRPAEAEAEARAALDLAPGLAVARLNLADALFRQARTIEAGAEFQRLLSDDPVDPRLRSAYILFLMQSGDRERARGVAQDARRDFPGIGLFDFCLARIEAASGKRDEALALLRSAIAKDPEARHWVASADEFKILMGDADFEELARP